MNRNRVISERSALEIESYIKSFNLRAIQAIVNSRTNSPCRSPTKPNSGSYEWFSLSLEEDETVKIAATKALNKISLSAGYSFCIEILLDTTDKDRLVLETWCLSFKEPKDVNVSETTVYSYMCVLLKSIVAVSRVSPAFKISLRQSPDSYTVHYRFYFGDPQTHVLGEDCQKHKIGEVMTPLGTLGVSLAFRTKMTISPQKINEESPFMVKSNYFQTDLSPKRICPPQTNGFNKPETNLNGAFKDDFKTTSAFAPFSLFPDPNLFPELNLPEKSILNLPCCSLSYAASRENSDPNANVSNGGIDNKEPSQVEEVDYNCNENGDCITTLTCSRNSEYGDFVMVDMKPAFAPCDSDSDLSAFFRVWHEASPIASFAAQQSFEQQVSDIGNQLAQYELSMRDFDVFVDSVCQVDANNK